MIWFLQQRLAAYSIRVIISVLGATLHLYPPFKHSIEILLMLGLLNNLSDAHLVMPFVCVPHKTGYRHIMTLDLFY